MCCGQFLKGLFRSREEIEKLSSSSCPFFAVYIHMHAYICRECSVQKWPARVVCKSRVIIYICAVMSKASIPLFTSFALPILQSNK